MLVAMKALHHTTGNKCNTLIILLPASYT